jgi:hypothetical protein
MTYGGNPQSWDGKFRKEPKVGPRGGSGIGNPPKRYCLVKDDDGHNYIIPADKLEAWEEYISDVYSFDWRDEMPGTYPPEEPSWVYRLAGSSINLTFTDPEEFGDKIVL